MFFCQCILMSTQQFEIKQNVCQVVENCKTYPPLILEKGFLLKLDLTISGESSCPVGQVEFDIKLTYHQILELLLAQGKRENVNVEPWTAIL